MTQLLSTAVVPREQRLAYWTDMICNVYVQLGCDPVPGARSHGDFEGSIRQHTLPSLDVSVVRSGPQKVMRTAGHIARSSDDYFLVSEALSDSMAESIGIETIWSQFSRTRRLRPLPSEPTTMQTGSVARARSGSETSPSPSSPRT